MLQALVAYRNSIGMEYTFIYLFHNSSYMQKTQIMTSKNNIACKLRNMI